MEKIEKIETEMEALNDIIDELDHHIAYCDCSDGDIIIRASDNDPCKDTYKTCTKCFHERVEREALQIQLIRKGEELEEAKLLNM